ncbi:MAG: tryptophan--tRNA ligase [Alphaproteobacteria bacterium]
MKRFFSGIRPTGNIHLGNYLGALRSFVNLIGPDDEHFFCIVDQHALTTFSESKQLSQNTRLIAAALLACGLDHNRTTIFVQSHVPFHTELSWYLSCFTPIGWLNRMTQFKEKSQANKQNAALGLYAYPTLMAADILLYKTTHVPVGEDQKQHVEFARDLAQLYNHRYGKDVFVLPTPIINNNAARIMSLKDGTKKMSKSDPSEYSRINLLDEADTIALKIRKAKTDSEPLPDSVEGLKNRPEAKNLLTIYAALCDKSLEKTCLLFAGQNFSILKKQLIDITISSLEPIKKRIDSLLFDEKELNHILYKGSEKARQYTFKNIKVIRQNMGLLHIANPV